MTIITEAKDNADKLTIEQFDELESMLDELYPDGMTETQLNDLMWFDFDTIKNWLGLEEDEERK